MLALSLAFLLFIVIIIASFKRLGSPPKSDACQLPSHIWWRCRSIHLDIELELRSCTLPVMPNNQGTDSGDASYHPPALRQRDPPTFSGLELDDVEDWIDGYEEVARNNRGDDGTKLVNVVFSLSGVAKTWFLNHEADFDDWATFCFSCQELFGQPASGTADAERRLSSRTQLGSEIIISYIAGSVSVALGKRADPTMPDLENVRHITKGICDDAFNMIV